MFTEIDLPARFEREPFVCQPGLNCKKGFDKKGKLKNLEYKEDFPGRR
jgi:hypothetical protein